MLTIRIVHNGSNVLEFNDTEDVDNFIEESLKPKKNYKKKFDAQRGRTWVEVYEHEGHKQDVFVCTIVEK